VRPLAKELYNWAEEELAAQIHTECGHRVIAREEENAQLVARVSRTLALQEANYLTYRDEGARLLTTLAAINHEHEVRSSSCAMGRR
jgi:hypothetical protein